MASGFWLLAKLLAMITARLLRDTPAEEFDRGPVRIYGDVRPLHLYSGTPGGVTAFSLLSSSSCLRSIDLHLP